MKKGFFVVLEGVDGSGTTTQAARLGARLGLLGHRAVVTREPTDGAVGRFLRSLLTQTLVGADGAPIALDARAMALLFAADRADHVAREIEPEMTKGAIVVSDRYDLSSLVYQSATSADGPAILPWLRELNGAVLRPDLTIVLDVDPEEARVRRELRGGGEELFERADLQRRLAVLYRSAEQLRPEDEIVAIDGNQSADAVAERIFELVDGKLQAAGFSAHGPSTSTSSPS